MYKIYCYILNFKKSEECIGFLFLLFMYVLFWVIKSGQISAKEVFSVENSIQLIL